MKSYNKLVLFSWLIDEIIGNSTSVLQLEETIPKHPLTVPWTKMLFKRNRTTHEYYTKAALLIFSCFSLANHNIRN